MPENVDSSVNTCGHVFNSFISEMRAVASLEVCILKRLA